MNRVLSFLFLGFSATTLLFACKKEYSVDVPSLNTAAGTLYDSTGNCMTDTIHGTFYNGVYPGGDTAYVSVTVNVTAPGSYSIHTDLQNGFEFADSGFFNNTGLNTVLLRPIGSAILPSSTNFTFSFDSSTCMFTVNVKDSTGTGLGGTPPPAAAPIGNWQFSADSATYSGVFDTAVLKDTLGYRYLIIIGKTATDSAFGLFLSFPSGSIATGVYTSQDTPPSFNGMERDNLSSKPVFIGASKDPPASNISITVTSYNTSTRQLTGTFSGMAANSSGDVVINVTNGSFTATVGP